MRNTGLRSGDPQAGQGASTQREAMEAAFPERKGRIYGRTGLPRHAGSGAMILDTAL